MRRPLVTYDFASDLIWISWYRRKILFHFYQWSSSLLFMQEVRVGVTPPCCSLGIGDEGEITICPWSICPWTLYLKNIASKVTLVKGTFRPWGANSKGLKIPGGSTGENRIRETTSRHRKVRKTKLKFRQGNIGMNNRLYAGPDQDTSVRDDLS